MIRILYPQRKRLHVHQIGIPIGPSADLKAVTKSKIPTLVVHSVLKVFPVIPLFCGF